MSILRRRSRPKDMAGSPANLRIASMNVWLGMCQHWRWRATILGSTCVRILGRSCGMLIRVLFTSPTATHNRVHREQRRAKTWERRWWAKEGRVEVAAALRRLARGQHVNICTHSIIQSDYDCYCISNAGNIFIIPDGSFVENFYANAQQAKDRNKIRSSTEKVMALK